MTRLHGFASPAWAALGQRLALCRPVKARSVVDRPSIYLALGTLFLTWLTANVFVVWSFEAWFGFGAPPPGRIHPIIDYGVIMPLAWLLVALQLPAGIITVPLSMVVEPGTASGITLLSFASTVVYSPFVLHRFGVNVLPSGLRASLERERYRLGA